MDVKTLAYKGLQKNSLVNNFNFLDTLVFQVKSLRSMKLVENVSPSNEIYDDLPTNETSKKPLTN